MPNPAASAERLRNRPEVDARTLLLPQVTQEAILYWTHFAGRHFMARPSKLILTLIREEFFAESQEAFSERVHFSRETVNRFESGAARLTFKHLQRFRQLLRVPKPLESQLEAALEEMLVSLRTEYATHKKRSSRTTSFGLPPSAPGALQPPLLPNDVSESLSGLIQQTVDSAARLQSEMELLRAQKAHRQEESMRALSEHLQRAAGLREEFILQHEQFMAEMKAWWTPRAEQLEDALRQAQALSSSTGLLVSDFKSWWRGEVRKVHLALAFSLSLVERRLKEGSARLLNLTATLRAQTRRFRHLALATAGVASLLLLLSSGLTAQSFHLLHLDLNASSSRVAHSPDDAQGGTNPPQASASLRPQQAHQEPSAEVTTGLDGGTAVTQAVFQALLMPSGGLPGQMTAPCPPTEAIEEIGGFCWWKQPQTAEQVNLGACEDQGFYEPSAGWCEAHKVGYRPCYKPRRTNNVVNPQ